ncbi:MAG TPA: serine hydrolase domain-containing protein [Stellaceae bacterium]|nr:serine hydrolase domain-containing protein [Stellaceae bacterium]
MRANIDAALQGTVERREVPGVVAMAASEKGLIYRGAFGVRAFGQAPAMTLDTVFRIASMTKAITCVAALQLVEAGKLSLDGTLPDIDPALSAPKVLDGFAPDGTPQLRPAKRPVTLRHLMTHTAGFTYEMWNADTLRYVEASGTPMVMSGQLAALRRPLNFDPGERWEYGINIDWIGRLVEAASGQALDAYLRDHIFAPLGIPDTGFAPTSDQRARQASVHQRQADGSLVPQPLEALGPREFLAGGGGLYSTAGDYLRFLQMLLHGGSLDGARILQAETVAEMNRNQIGDLPAGVLKSSAPLLTNDVDFFPGARIRWGLGYMLNLDPGPNGRSAGTVSWAGLFNSYYWLDPVRRITGVILTQILPFADPAAVSLYGQFERSVYALAEAA